MPFKPRTHDQLMRAEHPERFPPRHIDDNARRRADPTSADSKRFYASARWQRFRRLILSRHPLCVACLAAGRTEPATDVDHIRTIRAGGALLDEANVQTLCHSCHARKTASEAAAARP